MKGTTGLTTVAMAEEDSEEEAIQAIIELLGKPRQEQGEVQGKAHSRCEQYKSKTNKSEREANKNPERSLPVKWTASKVH